MRTEYYLNGKKVTRKAIKAIVGEQRLADMIAESKETFLSDPNIRNDYYIGGGRMLTIVFR